MLWTLDISGRDFNAPNSLEIRLTHNANYLFSYNEAFNEFYKELVKSMKFYGFDNVTTITHYIHGCMNRKIYKEPEVVPV